MMKLCFKGGEMRVGRSESCDIRPKGVVVLPGQHVSEIRVERLHLLDGLLFIPGALAGHIGVDVGHL